MSALQSAAPAATPIFTGLRKKLIIAFLAVLLIPVVEIGFYGYFFTSRVLSQQALDGAEREVQLQAQHIVRSLAQAQGDALFLSQLRSLAKLRELMAQHAPSAEIDLWREEAAQDFMVLLSVRPMVQNLRYIDSGGREVVRADSDGQTVHSSPRKELRDRSEFAYFQQAMALTPGSVFVSPFAIDQDMDENSPLVHYALRTSDGNGVIVVDLHAAWILRNLPANVTQDTWALIDQDGNYLVYPENYAPASNDAGKAHIHSAMNNLLSGGAGTFETDTSVFVYNTVFPAANSQSQFWVLYRDTPRAVLYADVSDFYQKAALFVMAAVLLAVGLAIFTSQGIVSPILDLRRKAEHLGHGGEVDEMPLELPTDEIGSLTRTFYEMAHDLERKRREAQMLIERLITAQEEERKLVAYDLHDGLIQHMVGARFHLSNCRQLCPIRDNEHATAGLVRGCDALTNAIVEGRRIIEGLRPAALDDLGLGAALTELAHSTAEHSDWQLSLDVHPLSQEPEKSVGVTLYRIAQEALNNARKHAQAKHVQLSLSNGYGISLSIQDDGRGFEPEIVSREERGLGITTMRERAALLHGTCELVSTPGVGTTIQVWIPWQVEAANTIHLTDIPGGETEWSTPP
jgi:signal transduction histidine kinase